ncbi:Hypothetical Protein SLY_0503 [Strawberry lethal yellows phytoplasma (CPA) str. NZSb11]|uniref:Uncharacterized protein n=1 Tax=Strawberry lethal yellows phytoplasma (CPA) str. NZSb11 TaxID=980422 RepID=R4RX18_PHYAS|nr:Hypothetical Protein SLY_0503 [Strawberry lethal yellows phytoplasma (CPA) str. NZSb11]
MKKQCHKLKKAKQGKKVMLMKVLSSKIINIR